MSLAIFRITQVDGQDTTTVQDPYIQVGYYSHGVLGTRGYNNEPIHLVAVPRKSGYPYMRWLVLGTSRLHIGAVLHTERFDVMIATGQLVDFNAIGPAGAQVYSASINVQKAMSIAGGGMWYQLQRSQVTKDPDDEGVVDDILHQRVRKLAGRGARWIWNKFF